MSETKDVPKKEVKPPTEDEIKARKKELTAFYAEEMPLLKKQAEYEELLTKIEVSKMTRLEIMIARAQIMKGPEESPKKRKLKEEE